jgi:hypothetical protein
MSRKPEQKLWDRLSSKTKHLVDWTRIETAFIGTGMPDTNGIIIEDEPRENEGFEFWLELKVISTKQSIPLATWRPAQISWQTKRARRGGRVWNLIHRPSSSQLELVHGNRLTCYQIIPDLIVDDGQFTAIIDFIRNH